MLQSFREGLHLMFLDDFNEVEAGTEAHVITVDHDTGKILVGIEVDEEEIQVLLNYYDTVNVFKIHLKCMSGYEVFDYFVKVSGSLEGAKKIAFKFLKECPNTFEFKDLASEVIRAMKRYTEQGLSA
ncbi:MAG: hypothetical protein LBS29_04855 [Endomicrobium sp.]|jgi:hypothetical protein|nr:hypothetical protein [Endomicrobium sp.]